MASIQELKEKVKKLKKLLREFKQWKVTVAELNKMVIELRANINKIKPKAPKTKTMRWKLEVKVQVWIPHPQSLTIDHQLLIMSTTRWGIVKWTLSMTRIKMNRMRGISTRIWWTSGLMNTSMDDGQISTSLSMDTMVWQTFRLTSTTNPCAHQH